MILFTLLNSIILGIIEGFAFSITWIKVFIPYAKRQLFGSFVIKIVIIIASVMAAIGYFVFCLIVTVVTSVVSWYKRLNTLIEDFDMMRFLKGPFVEFKEDINLYLSKFENELNKSC